MGDAADLVKLHGIIINWDSSNVKARPTDLEALEPRQIIKVGGTIEIILIKFDNTRKYREIYKTFFQFVRTRGKQRSIFLWILSK